MSVVAIVLAVLNALICLVWAGRHLLINSARRDNPTLVPADPGPPADAPLLSVLVAAKDEEENIGRCIDTMAGQDYPDFEILVINDRSDDRTAEIVEAKAGADPRVRLINITELPDGWCGKNHAMWQGIKQARGQWLCMIDADCRQTSERTLSVAFQHAIDHESDLLSVLPNLEMKGFWENVVQPVCSGVMVFWFHPEKVNDADSDVSYANGAFLLMRREAYDAIGTHEAVKGAMLEDMQFALRIKRQGLKLRVVQNDGLYVVRMYTSLAQIVRGWCRIFFCTFGTRRRLRVSMGVLVVMGMTPHLSALAGFIGYAATGATGWLVAALAGMAAGATQFSVIGRFYKLVKARPSLCWTYPIGCVVGMISLLKAYGKHRAGAEVVWRDTTYSTGTKK